MNISRASVKNFVQNVPLTFVLVVFATVSTYICVYSRKVALANAIILTVASFFVSDSYSLMKKRSIKRIFWAIIISFLFLESFIGIGYYDNICNALASHNLPIVGAIILMTFIGIIMIIASLWLINFALERENDQLTCKAEKIENNKIYRVCLITLVVLSSLLLVVGIFDQMINLVDIFTMKLIPYSVSELIDITAHDVHPPLYYLMLKAWLAMFSFVGDDIYSKIFMAKIFR